MATPAAQTPVVAAPSQPVKPGKVAAEERVKFHRIRITLTSRNAQNLEKGNSSPLCALAALQAC
jgi:hypothetical protein